MESSRPINIKENRAVYNSFYSPTYGREKIIQYLESLFQNYKDNYQSNNKDEDKKKNLTPDQMVIKLAQLPSYVLIFFLVEIKLMQKEEGCFEYYKREEECIPAFFEASGPNFSNLENLKADEDSIKSLHKTNTDPKKVKMSEISPEDSGNYRKDKENITLDLENLSVKGLAHLLNLIEIGPLSTMRIGAGNALNSIKSKLKENEDFCRVLTLIKKANVEDETEFSHLIDEIKNIDKSEDILGYFENVRNFLESYLKDMNEQLAQLNDEEGEDRREILYQISQVKQIHLLMDKNQNNLKQIILLLNKIEIESKIFESITDYYENQWEDCKSYLISQDSIAQLRDTHHVYSNEELADKLLKEWEDNQEIFFMNFVAPEKIDATMKQLFDECDRQMEEFKKEKEPDFEKRIEFMAKYTQLFLLVHPFADANNRTLINQRANRYLIQLGLPLAFYYNPFVFYGHSIPEICEVMKLSCANFLAILECLEKGNDKFDFLKSGLTEEDLARMDEFVKPFRDFVQKTYGVPIEVTQFDDYVAEWLTLTRIVADSFTHFLTEAAEKIKPDSSRLFSSDPIETMEKNLAVDFEEFEQCGSSEKTLQLAREKLAFYEGQQSQLKNLYSNMIPVLEEKKAKLSSHQPRTSHM